MDGRPPLAVSPRRLRRHKTIHYSSITSVQASKPPKSKIPSRSSVSYDSPRRSESQRITSELLSMAKQLHEDIENDADFAASISLPLASKNTSRPLFERGMFYELYSTRRNERLKRKQGEYLYLEEENLSQEPVVAIELAKRRSFKKSEGVRKSMPADFSVGRGSSLRSSLRSSKEMKKSSVASGFEGSAAGGKRTSARSSVRRL